MLSDNIKDIQQRLHELNVEETKFLADIQVSLAGIERIHAQRRIEELTLMELQRKAEEDRHERDDRKPRTKQGKGGQGGNKKRDADDWRSEPAQRQRRRGPNNAYGVHTEQGISVPIPGSSNHGNWNQTPNQPLSGGECKCSRVDVHCGGNGSTCQVCKALGCAGIAQSRYRNRRRNSKHHSNVPPVASSSASTWPHGAANTSVRDLQG